MPKHVSMSREGYYGMQTGRSILLCGFACMIMKCSVKQCLYIVCMCVCASVHVCVWGGGGALEYVYSVENTLPVWPKMTFILWQLTLVTLYYKLRWEHYRSPSSVVQVTGTGGVKYQYQFTYI